MTDETNEKDIEWRVSPAATSWFKTKLNAESAGKATSTSPRLVKKEPVTPVATRAEYRKQEPGALVTLVYLLWFILPISARCWAIRNDPELQGHKRV